ncbi:peptidylprolyl isomerase [Methanocalculus alkaliphilus]|uniref:FKBP-type peptidyl-prolyl cis-trans isomerase n=1 Tax=Methanocalculus alkaliphilus TaxID=768730 RepID=UPI0020A1CD68|nr:peptidylprolyl isomerase [Methanocalculus alkaliphilus]MCP1714291.1 peptidylprolyl isomerase [Methanocalculus alkaliphilus]
MNNSVKGAGGILILLAAFLTIAGCVGGSVAEEGDTVRVHYTGTLSDGSTFDSSVGREPLEFTIGAGEVIPGFDSAVIGMTVDETKTVTIPADEAYGQHRDDLLFTIEHELFPGEIPEIGAQVPVSMDNGMIAQSIVTSVNETAVILDLNHPLAGEDLTFEITLVQIL